VIKRVKTKWWSLLHGNPKTYSVIGSTLYRPKDKYLIEQGWPFIQKQHLSFFELKGWRPTDKDGHRLASILVHEAVHYQQQKNDGRWYFWWMTRHDKGYLLAAEKEAFSNQIWYLLDNGWKPTEGFIESFAKSLGHETYGGMMTYEEARSWVENIVDVWQENRD